jgi:hypothetical protein
MKQGETGKEGARLRTGERSRHCLIRRHILLAMIGRRRVPFLGPIIAQG